MTQERYAALQLLRDYPAQYGRMLGYEKLNDELHGEWMKTMLLGSGNITLQAHRGSYKTTCVGVVMTENIFLRGWCNSIFVRKTDTDVREVIKQVIRNIKHPVTQTLYRAITGKELQLLKATDTEVTTSAYLAPRGASQLLGMGIKGSITGKHADWIWTDDIVNLDDRKSRAEREATKLAYQELLNVVNPGGRIVNTGTPWHKEDCFTIMPEPQRYDCYTTHLLDAEKLDLLRQSMSPSLFAANYELRHIASEQALFTEAPAFFDDPALLRDGKAHVDAAYGGEDFTAFTCAKRVGDTIYMYGKLWDSHVDKHLGAIAEEVRRLQCAPVMCEDNGDKGFLAKEMIKNYGLKAVTYHENENKYIKISSFLRKWWTHIKWLEGTDQDYLNQILDYTEDAEHDDAPDSASVLCRYFDRRSGESYKSFFG